MTVYKVVLNGSGLLEMKVTAESGDNHLIYLLPIVTGYTLTEISSGSYFAVALDITGRAWGWAVNTYGQLGTNNITCYSSPVSVVGGKNFCHISTGNYHSLAIESNGQAWAWGENTYGNLGTNNTTSYSSPVSVVGGKTFCKISGGFEYSLAIDNLGQAWAWGGYNYSGQLGTGNHTDYSSPVSVVGVGIIFCQITASQRIELPHSLGIDKQTLGGWSWGCNDCGQLGTNDTNSYCSPVNICGKHTFCHISAGQYGYSLAIDNLGQAWAWGYNGDGQLGTNNTTSYSSPVSVVGGKTFCYISAGGVHSLAIDNLGQAWAWGSNINGELGVNNTTNYSSPVAVCGNHIFCYITAGMGGGGITYAIDTDGKGWAWGRGDLGILGNNTCNVAVCTPVAICPPY